MYPKRPSGKSFRTRPQRHNIDTVARLSNLKPYVRQTGDQWRPPWFLANRKLLDYLIVYIAKGHGRFTVRGEAFDVGDGDIVWIPPDTEHEMRGYEPVMHCVYAHFDLIYDPRRSHWDANIPGGIVDLSAYRDLIHPPVNDAVITQWCGLMKLANHATIGMLLGRACLEHHRDPAGSVVQVSGIMMEVICEILKGQGVQPERTKDFRWDGMQKCFMNVRDKAEDKLVVRDLAAGLRLSQSHFRRLFRAVHGKSPRQVHRDARMQRGKELLTYSMLTVSEIADKLGFSTVHNFSRAFRDVTGTSPRQYRKGG